MSYIPSRTFIVSELNSTDAPLAANEIFTGSSEDVSEYATISLIISTDQNSKLDGFRIEFSSDGINWDISRKHSIIVANDEGREHLHVVIAKFFRIVLENSDVDQTYLRIQTIFHVSKPAVLVEPLNAHLSEDHSAILSRSVLTGETIGNHFVNVGVTPERALEIDVIDPSSAFGEITTQKLTPVSQVSFFYNVNSDMINSTVTGSGAISQAAGLAELSTTNSTNSSAMIQTIRHVKYRAGQGIIARLSGLFSTGILGSYQWMGIGTPEENGYFFKFEEDVFGIEYVSNTVSNFIPQADFNVDTLDGSSNINNPSSMLLDPTKGNAYQIVFQADFGAFTFLVEEPTTGRFIICHRIHYPNSALGISTSMSSFPLSMKVKNTTNTSIIICKSSGMFGAIQGEIALLGPRNSISNTKTSVGTTLTNILTIRNKATFNSLANYTTVLLELLSAAVDGTKPASIYIILNATLGGTPAYTDISTNTSVIEYDVASTTVSGGSERGVFILSKEGGITQDLHSFLLELNSNDTLTFAAKASSGNTDVTISVNWIEDF